jgi:hypothetical protein
MVTLASASTLNNYYARYAFAYTSVWTVSFCTICYCMPSRLLGNNSNYALSYSSDL